MIKVKLRPQARAALQIAIKTGVLVRCPRHGTYVDSLRDDALQHAYRLGNYLITHFARSVACFKGDRQQLAEAIQQCRRKAGAICPHCAEEAGEPLVRG